MDAVPHFAADLDYNVVVDFVHFVLFAVSFVSLNVL